MRESEYQKQVINRIRNMFPGCFIQKNDSGYTQGIPDWVVYYGTAWAMLEIKVSRTAAVQPNQEYYVEKLSKMSFAAFIYPENEEDVLNELQQALRPGRKTRLPKS